MPCNGTGVTAWLRSHFWNDWVEIEPQPDLPGTITSPALRQRELQNAARRRIPDVER